MIIAVSDDNLLLPKCPSDNEDCNITQQRSPITHQPRTIKDSKFVCNKFWRVPNGILDSAGLAGSE